MASATMVREPPGGRASGPSGTPRTGPPAPRPARIPLDRRTAVTLIGGSLPLVVGFSVAPAGAVTGYLPQAAYDLLLSFTRMVLAYGLSLGFSLGYGYLSAANRPAERVMIPTLDILPGSWVGPNLASIFLIFTSMSWNMVFGVYESLKSIPSDLREASDSFGV